VDEVKSAATSDEQLVLSLFRKLLHESYVDTEGGRFLLDGSTYEATAEELAALDRWDPPE
jgi:hypothetical protein